jgi:hypothetical protein
MTDPNPRPPSMTRRGFVSVGLGGGLVALVALSRLHHGPSAGAARAGPKPPREPLIAFLSALFGRDLTAEDRADLSERLALFIAEPALGHDCSVLADHLDRMARAENARDFLSCEPAAKERIVDHLMAIDPHSLSARLLSRFSSHFRDYFRMRWSTVPSLEWLYRHSAAAWRARGYTRWPGVPGDWRVTLVPGPPYP